MMIWNELGVSGGTALIVLCALYFVIKWAVRKGVMEAHERIGSEKRGWLQTACGALSGESGPAGADERASE